MVSELEVETDSVATTLAAIKQSCLYYLMRREHGYVELVTKVQAKGFERDSVMQVIDQLSAQGLQSDTRFVESYARSRIHKGIGPLRIRAELQQRGIRDADFDHAVVDIAGSWAELLEQVYTHKYGVDAQRLPSQERLKRTRFLLQRGFPSDLIQRLFKRMTC